MVGEIRRKEICGLLKEHSAVTTVMLAEKFDISIETIRKDLLLLEKANELDRVHGGAVAKSTVKRYKTYSQRVESMIEEKKEISKIASKLIKNGDIIALDTGSTAKVFIDVLMEKFDCLTIVTHSADVFDAARSYKDFEIILCGGFYLKSENSFYGDFALEMLDNIRVSKAFIFPSGISLNGGICDSIVSPLAQMQKKLITCADEIIVVADSSKYEKTSLMKISDTNKKYTYICDSKLPEEIKQIYRANEINIITREDEIK